MHRSDSDYLTKQFFTRRQGNSPANSFLLAGKVKITSSGYSKLVRQKQLRKALLLVLLSVSDYKRVYTTLYFIITNIHVKLKPQVKVSHGMNSPAFTLYTTFD